MKFVLAHEGDGAVITISGVMKKEHAKQIAETIAEVSRLKPKKLALDCSELSAMSYDSCPFIVSALERARIGKDNVRALGCNNVIERTLRGGGFERVGTLG